MDAPAEECTARQNDGIYIPAQYAFSFGQRIYLPIKRLFDVLLASLMIVLLSPVLLIAAMMIKIENLGPVIFRQQRMGKDGRTIVIYKLRTMSEVRPEKKAAVFNSGGNRYVTGLGAFLRRTSIDETPQLFNVLKGEMSIVGPRPLMLAETEIHAMRMRQGVYAIRPGLTGLAQVNGRDLVTARQKAELDAAYLKKIGFSTDVGILLRSVAVVVMQKGISERDKPVA